MKTKIAVLEKQGINPTREHVQSHLNNIKKFTFRKFNSTYPSAAFSPDEKPLGHLPNSNQMLTPRPVEVITQGTPRAPPARIPNPWAQNAQPAPATRVQPAPRVVEVMVGKIRQPTVIQRKRPEKKGPKLVIVKVKML